MTLFTDFLLEQLNTRDWSQADLAKKAGLSRAAISDVMSERRNPGVDLCTSIAEAFDLPPETVFRAAGLLPPAPEITPVMERALYYLSQLDPEDQERVMLYLEVLASRYKLTGERP